MNLLTTPTLVDGFGRKIDYLRISVTDRCDFRCVYCMAEEMTFLPRSHILTLEEIEKLASIFVDLGIKKIRITGGEPLIRKGILKLLKHIGQLALNELVLTTNGSHLYELANDLKQVGVQRINISLDTLNANKFKQLTRVGDLYQVLKGINKAKEINFKRLKINAVILKHTNHTEVCDLVQFAVDNDLDISFIEEMPLGLVGQHNRSECYYSSADIKKDLAKKFTLLPNSEKTAGPSNYFSINNTHTKVGFISPHSENFCPSCNRIRLTVEGRLLLCLGNEHSIDLKALLRQQSYDELAIKQAIVESMKLKPEKHEFNIHEQPIIFRHMNVTGG